jgi:hypothetical protein
MASEITRGSVAAQITFNSPDAVKVRLAKAEARIVELEAELAKKNAEIERLSPAKMPEEDSPKKLRVFGASSESFIERAMDKVGF